MKKSSKLACLFGLWLLSTLLTVVSINVVWASAWVKMDLSKFTDLQSKTLHKVRLKKLYLWDGDNDSKKAWISASSTAEILDIYKGLIVDDSIDVLTDENPDSWDLIVVGWWQSNRIRNSNYSGIAWWKGNTIEWWASAIENAAIGGGNGNSVLWNNGVVAWWEGNKWDAWWVVLWWKNNTSTGVVLWWIWNSVGENGLAMWKWAKWWNWSFVRNDGTYNGTADGNSAIIWTLSWVLIGTYDIKDWVTLVVNWPVQIWKTDDSTSTGTEWEIRSINGCLYAFDGAYRHVMGNSSAETCNGDGLQPMAKTCKFGRVYLQEWDRVTAYKEQISTSCESKQVVCRNENLVVEGESSTEYMFPSCFQTSATPYYLPN